jgi:hypothetical protein
MWDWVGCRIVVGNLEKSCHFPLQGIETRTVLLIVFVSGFGGLEVACWPLVPKFVGSHSA